MAPDGQLAFASNPGSGDITLVDVAKRQAVHTMPTSKGAMMASVLVRSAWLWSSMRATTYLPHPSFWGYEGC